MVSKLPGFKYPRRGFIFSSPPYMYGVLLDMQVQVQCEASSVWPRGVVDSIMVCGTIDPSSILGGAATDVVS